MKKSISILSFLGVCLASSPALASSIPAVDLAGRQTECSIGLVHLSLDSPMFDRLSVGGNLTWDFFSGDAQLRANYRLGGNEKGFEYGAGLVYHYLMGETLSDGYGHYLQPALTLAYSLLPNLKIRAILGPSIGVQKDWGTIRLGNDLAANFEPVAFALSALEVAWQMNPKVELTAGGQSLLGARLIF